MSFQSRTTEDLIRIAAAGAGFKLAAGQVNGHWRSGARTTSSGLRTRAKVVLSSRADGSPLVPPDTRINLAHPSTALSAQRRPCAHSAGSSLPSSP